MELLMIKINETGPKNIEEKSFNSANKITKKQKLKNEIQKLTSLQFSI